MNRITISLAIGVLTFVAILFAYGLFQAFGNVAVYAALGGVFIGLLIFLIDLLTEKKPDA